VAPPAHPSRPIPKDRCHDPRHPQRRARRTARRRQCALLRRAGRRRRHPGLIDTDKRQQHAYITRDWKALDEIFTDDYVLVLWNGTQRTKAEILESAALPDSKWDINETGNWQVRIHGDLGIVVAELHQKGTSEGQAFDSVVKFSDTYIREQGKWRNVHAHASKSVPVEAKKGP
jgi:ketosteroid isomerase-like protein